MITGRDKTLHEKLLVFYKAFKDFDAARQRHANTAWKADSLKVVDATRGRMYQLAAEVEHLLTAGGEKND